MTSEARNGDNLDCLVGQSELVFKRLNVSDRVQFWCEQTRMSIFITANGVESCGPDCMNRVMWHKDNMPNGKDDRT